MSSTAQLAANRANAQKSTGPKTAEGKQKSAANSIKHNLHATPVNLFENDPKERSHFDALNQKLFERCLPEGEPELQAFERYAFATFQAGRARSHEIAAEQRWLNEPDSDRWFHQMERFIKIAAMQERRADRALNELRKLQRDRYASIEVHVENYVNRRQQAEIPASLPIFEMNMNPSEAASMFANDTPESKYKIANGVYPDLSHLQLDREWAADLFMTASGA